VLNQSLGIGRENFAVGVNVELLERFFMKNLILKVSKNIHLFIHFHSKTFTTDES